MFDDPDTFVFMSGCVFGAIYVGMELMGWMPL